MSLAYDRGREDGARGPRYLDETRGGGFDLCYWTGVGHAARVCYCPQRIGARWDDVPCPCCGQRRETNSLDEAIAAARGAFAAEEEQGK